MARAGSNYDLDQDLFDDRPEEPVSQQFASTQTPRRRSTPRIEVATHDDSGRPLTQKAQAGLRRQARVEQSKKEEKAAGGRRRRWEASPEGQERMKTASDLYGTSMSPGQIYHAQGWGQRSGPGVGERQLPGLENPAEASAPKQWEELTPQEQARTHVGLRRYGTSLEHMSRSFGAQLDQSYHRAQGHAGPGNEAVPFSRDFYNPSLEQKPGAEITPGQRIRQSAHELGVPYSTHVAMNSITSPQTKFKQNIRGEDRFPNDESARFVVQRMQAGADPTNVPRGRQGLQGFAKNMVKAGRVYEHLEAGGQLKDATGFGPKTGPYHNSWLPDAPDFFVSDVHSGGGGMVPHLSSTKPVKTDEEGNKIRKPEYRDDPRSDEELAKGMRLRDETSIHVRDKSQREMAIERVPNFHSAADFAARQAMSQRGLTSVRQAQASQWGEEQIKRTKENPRLDLAHEEKVYRPNVGQQFDPGPHHGKLF